MKQHVPLVVHVTVKVLKQNAIDSFYKIKVLAYIYLGNIKYKEKHKK